MKDWIDFDTCPYDEDCVQVQTGIQYMPAMRNEALRFKEMLEKRFPDAPGTWLIASNPHDFGTYLSLRYHYEDNQKGTEWMLFIERNMPSTWDDDKVLDRNAFLASKRIDEMKMAREA